MIGVFAGDPGKADACLKYCLIWIAVKLKVQRALDIAFNLEAQSTASRCLAIAPILPVTCLYGGLIR